MQGTALGGSVAKNNTPNHHNGIQGKWSSNCRVRREAWGMYVGAVWQFLSPSAGMGHPSGVSALGVQAAGGEKHFYVAKDEVKNFGPPIFGC